MPAARWAAKTVRVVLRAENFRGRSECQPLDGPGTPRFAQQISRTILARAQDSLEIAFGVITRARAAPLVCLKLVLGGSCAKK